MTTVPREGEAGALEKVVTFDGDEQARRLAVGERLLLDTLVMLRTGSCVVVAIERTGPSQWVLSDLGSTSAEATFLGLARSYERLARNVVQEFGLELEPTTFAVWTRVGECDRVAGAVACVANAARSAFDRAFEAAGRSGEEKRIERLARRLERLAGARSVERSVEVLGSSNHRWRVDARVCRNGRQLLLDLVTPHPNSVATTVAKFHDLARLPDPPGRIAVVLDRAAMGTLLGVLSQAANVIEENAPDSAWKKVLAA